MAASMIRSPGASYNSVRNCEVEIASVLMKTRHSCVISIGDFGGCFHLNVDFHFLFNLCVYKPIVIMPR